MKNVAVTWKDSILTSKENWKIFLTETDNSNNMKVDITPTRRTFNIEGREFTIFLKYSINEAEIILHLQVFFIENYIYNCK